MPAGRAGTWRGALGVRFVPSAREIRELFLVVSFILLSLVAPLLSIIKNLLQVVLELVKYVPTY